MAHPKKIREGAILEEALAIVRGGGGAEALSMRGLAEAMGVRASSLYRHYPDRGSLVEALAAAAAAALEGRMRPALKRKTPAAACRAMAQEYARFAREEPALFELLLAPPYQSAADSSGKSLWNLILGAVGSATSIPDDTPAAVAFWSFLHGFAVLERSGGLGPAGSAAGFDAGVEALLKGLADPARRPAKARAGAV